MSKCNGTKYDKQKSMMSLLPAAALKEVADIMTFGATKYSPNNWREGFKWSRLSDAALRHIFSYLDGERIDPESGRSHLSHAVCMLLMLIEHELKDYGEDDLYQGEMTRDKLTETITEMFNNDVFRGGSYTLCGRCNHYPCICRDYDLEDNIPKGSCQFDLNEEEIELDKPGSGATEKLYKGNT